jgi:small subunit ribosomal protein S12e
MSDAGDEVKVEAPVEVEVTDTAPKGKLSVEEALQVDFFGCNILYR